MFEHVQRRNRRPFVVPVLVAAVLLIAIYALVDRCSRKSSDDVFEAVSMPAPIALSEHRSLERISLPGMSIALPEPETQRTGDYLQGSVQCGSTAGIGWSVGKLPHDRRFAQEQLASLGMGKQPPVETTLGGAFAYEESIAETHTLLGECGRRTVFLQVAASLGRWEEIKQSFRCTPERELAHLGVIVAPHASWHRDRDDPKLHLVDATGMAQMTLQSRKDSSDPRGRMTIPQDATPEVHGIYRVWRGRGISLDNKPLLTALVDWQCQGQPYFGEALITSKGPIDEAIALALTGSCIAMDAPLPKHLRLE